MGLNPVLLLELLHLQRHPLAVLAVLLLQGLDLWLQFLHLPGGPDLPDERLVQIARSVKTRNITDSAQVKKFDGPNTKANSLYQSHMIPDTG